MQTARIFSTAVKTVEGKQNTCGEPYVQLTARAYLPRTQENQALITEIESGIKKEVSVGCAVKKRVCSICGKEDGAAVTLAASIMRGNYAISSWKTPPMRMNGRLSPFRLSEPPA